MRRLAPFGATFGVAAQHLDVVFHGLARGLDVLVGDVGEVGRVDDHVDVAEALEVAEFAQLERGERSLQRSAPADDDHFLDPAVVQRLQRVIGDVGRGEHVGIGDQDARHVQRDVAVADDDGAPARNVGRHLLEVRVRVVPADEVDGGHAAGQVLAGNAQRPVGLRADGVDHRVVALGQLGGLHMVADHDVAEEPEPRIQRRLLELGADRLDLRMVRGDAGAHQAPRRRQHLQHVDAHVGVVVAESANFSSDAAAK